MAGLAKQMISDRLPIGIYDMDKVAEGGVRRSPMPHGDRRLLTLVFPHLSTDRIARRRWGISWRSACRSDHAPIVLAGRRGDRMCLTALDEVSQRLGLMFGQCVVEARAMFPALDVLDEDGDADIALLRALADWCDRYTPLVQVDGRDRLSLDITVCADHCRGEQTLLANVSHRLHQMGFDVKATIASSGHGSAHCFVPAASAPLPALSLRQNSPLRLSARNHGSLIRGV